LDHRIGRLDDAARVGGRNERVRREWGWREDAVASLFPLLPLSLPHKIIKDELIERRTAEHRASGGRFDKPFLDPLHLEQVWSRAETEDLSAGLHHRADLVEELMARRAGEEVLSERSPLESLHLVVEIVTDPLLELATIQKTVWQTVWPSVPLFHHQSPSL
jgi:hypothetical protein